MRSFAALYFLLRLLIFTAGPVVTLFKVSNNDPYFPRNAIFVTALLLIAICRPYKKQYMNAMDMLLLALLALVCHLISSYQGFYYHTSFIYMCGIGLTLPFACFVLFLVIKSLKNIRRARAISSLLIQKCKRSFSSDTLLAVSVDSEPPRVDLILRAEILNDYGTIEYN